MQVYFSPSTTVKNGVEHETDEQGGREHASPGKNTGAGKTREDQGTPNRGKHGSLSSAARAVRTGRLLRRLLVRRRPTFLRLAAPLGLRKTCYSPRQRLLIPLPRLLPPLPAIVRIAFCGASGFWCYVVCSVWYAAQRAGFAGPKKKKGIPVHRLQSLSIMAA
jgi:hypothetical protein